MPETFVIDRGGGIACKHIGPVTPKILDDMLRPLIAKPRRLTPRQLMRNT